MAKRRGALLPAALHNLPLQIHAAPQGTAHRFASVSNAMVGLEFFDELKLVFCPSLR